MNSSKPNFKLIIGLGNPGPKYKNTYHNVGHLFVDYLQKNYRPQTTDRLLKTDVYMNESGKFVSKKLKKSGTKPEELLIVHDDSDIEIGNYKLSFNRGAAGHRGIENIQATLKTKNFWRLRIGIRPKQKENPPSLKLRRARAEEFVLKKISAENKKVLDAVFQKASLELKTDGK